MTITQIKPSRGFSLLELVIAIAIFAFGSFAMGAMLIDSSVSTNISIERTEALFYAKEGLEAVRSIRDNDWNTISALADGNHGISISSSTWNFSGVADTLNTKFTRTIYVTASSTASFVKSVAVTVDWPLLSGKLATTTLNTLVTNWINVRNLPSQISTDGLVSYWSFDDAIAGTAVDSVGTNTGTVSGATSTPGVRSYGYNFDGVDDYVSVSGDPVFNLLQGTISGWFKFNSMSGGVGFAMGSGWLDERFVLHFGWPVDGKIKFTISSSTSYSTLTSTSSPEMNRWYHIVTTYDAVDRKIYIDGVLNNSSASVITPLTSNVPLYIGKTLGLAPNYLNGSIDQVRIYNRALTPYEVGVIYSEEKP